MKYLAPALILLAFGFHGVGLLLIPIPFNDWYDEGVYYGSAVRLAEGDKPYRDFFCAHPPGVVWLNAVWVKLGFGIAGIRLVYWTLGLLYFVLLARFVCRILHSDSASYPRAIPVACLSVLFCAASPLLEFETTKILTHLPTLILTLLGFAELVRPSGPRPFLAGLWLAAASAFRVQAAFTAPAWVAFLLLSSGWKGGLRASIWLAMGAGLGALAFHGAMVLTYEHYWDCIIRYHSNRPLSGLSMRVTTLGIVLQEPQAALGLFGASCLLLSGSRLVRGLAGFSLVSFALTLFGARFIGEGYFVPVLPYLLSCGAILLAQSPNVIGMSRNVLAGALCVAALQGFALVPTLSYRLFRLAPAEHDFIRRLEETAGQTVLTTHVKSVQSFPTPFSEWFVATAPRADIIVVNQELLKYISPGLCRQLFALGKPIVFATDGDRAAFEERLAVQTNSSRVP
jgi:hypothetical protein